MTQFGGKQYDPKHFGSKLFPGGGVQSTPGTSPCQGVYYANRSDIELIFGKSNVAKWADVDNMNVLEDVDNRICWALQYSHAYINDALFGGPYKIPFSTPYPRQIIVECARFAGCALYDSRGVTDYDGNGKVQDSLSVQRKKTADFLYNVIARKMRLVGKTDVASTVPGIVSAASV